MWPSSVWAASEIPAAGYTALPIRLKHSLPCSASCGLQRGEKKKIKNKINKEIKACGDSCWAAVEPEEQQPCEWKSTAQHWPQLCVFLPFTRLSFSLRLFKNVDRKRCNLPARRLLQLMPVYAMSTELETRYFTHFWDWATQCVLWHWRSFFSHEIMNKRTDRKGGGGDVGQHLEQSRASLLVTNTVLPQHYGSCSHLCTHGHVGLQMRCLSWDVDAADKASSV